MPKLSEHRWQNQCLMPSECRFFCCLCAVSTVCVCVCVSTMVSSWQSRLAWNWWKGVVHRKIHNKKINSKVDSKCLCIEYFSLSVSWKRKTCRFNECATIKQQRAADSVRLWLIFLFFFSFLVNRNEEKWWPISFICAVKQPNDFLLYFCSFVFVVNKKYNLSRNRNANI